MVKNKRKQIVYISGAYSPYMDIYGRVVGTGENVFEARNVTVNLWEKGYTVICPHLNTTFFEDNCKCKYEDFINGDIEILKRCDIVFMLNNYRYSKGAMKELKIAKKLKKKIIYQ
jgi:hypothetical protein